MPRPNVVFPPKTQPTLDTDPIFRGVVAFNSPGVGVGTVNIRLGRIAAGSEILAAKIKTAVAWVGPTAATVSIGTNATTFDNIVAATSVLAATGTLALAATAAALEFLVDTDVFMQVITTVAPPTAGITRCVLDISTPLQGTAAQVNAPAGTPIPA